MGRAVVRESAQRRELTSPGEGSETFDVLRELTRNGYIPDASDAEASGILLRHDSAPDLVLHADGRIEVPLGQPRKSPIAGLVPGVRRGMSWRRTLVIVFLIGVVWFLSALLTANFLSL